MADPLILTMDDLRRHHCVSGIRRWFAANGLDFRDFVQKGIDAEVLLATGDALAVAVVEDAVRRREDSVTTTLQDRTDG